MNQTLTATQILALREALFGRKIVVCYGAGVDSTAMLAALKVAGIRPHLITFADTGGEKPETYAMVERMQLVLREWGFPQIDVCKKKTLDSTAYNDLEGNCVDNETLPSLAFGMKSCSIKWKHQPQDNFLMGVSKGPNACESHPLWIETQAAGERIVKLIGYDAGPADLRRSKKAPTADANFDYCYPLQILGWARGDCVKAIVEVLGPDLVPIKSACFFCPASKTWELYWLAANHPELFERALHMERTALTGRHSRFDVVEFGDTWESLVANADRFPSTSTTVGLGRKVAWNQWARVNNVVDENFRVRRDQAARFAAMADRLRGDDNAFDNRSCGDFAEVA
jgi:hypothetical protein